MFTEWILQVFSGGYGWPGAIIAWTLSLAVGAACVRFIWRQVLGLVTDTVRQRAAWRAPQAIPPIRQLILIQWPQKPPLEPPRAAPVNDSAPEPKKKSRRS